MVQLKESSYTGPITSSAPSLAIVTRILWPILSALIIWEQLQERFSVLERTMMVVFDVLMVTAAAIGSVLVHHTASTDARSSTTCGMGCAFDSLVYSGCNVRLCVISSHIEADNHKSRLDFVFAFAEKAS